MIGFVADQALPIGTRVRITLAAGLRDLDGDALDRDLAWTFETEPVAFTGLPQPELRRSRRPARSALRPTITITSERGRRRRPLSARTPRCGGSGNDVPVTANLEAQPTPYPGTDAAALFDPSVNAWVYDLTPARDLRWPDAIRSPIAPGVAPAYGNLPTATSFSGALRTYDPLGDRCRRRVPSPAARRYRFDTGDPVIAFNNPFDAKSIAGAVTISPAPARVKALTVVPDDDPDTIAIDPYALDPDTTLHGDGRAERQGRLRPNARPRANRHASVPATSLAGAWAPTGTNDHSGFGATSC